MSPALLLALRSRGGETRGAARLGAVATLTLSFAIVDLLLLIVLPWRLHRDAAAGWGSGEILGTLILVTAVALVSGFLMARRAECRGRTAWWFLAGHSGAFVAPFLMPDGRWPLPVFAAGAIAVGLSIAATFLLPRGTASTASPPDRPLEFLGRAYFLSGDIRVGIAILVTLAAALAVGTWWETFYGARSAHHAVYGSPWFATLLGLLGVSLITATLRKYPWRLDQIGWLVIHASLVFALIGGLITVHGRVEGELTLAEGESNSVFRRSDRSVLEIRRADGTADGVPFWRAAADFAVDPRQREPRRTYRADFGHGRTLDLVVERYFSNARPVAATFEPIDFTDGRAVAQVRIDDGSGRGMDAVWLGLDLDPVQIAFGGTRLVLAWTRDRADLGFRLRLDDFRRDFHPGGTEERAFASHVTAFTAAEPNGTKRVIDMNHPLRLDGWRLYQSRFSTRGGDRTYLMVNRDPGLLLTWTSTAFLALGLVVVFFQKPFLRRLEGVRPQLPLPPWALAVLILAAITVAAAPGIWLMSHLDDPAYFLLGLIAIVVGVWAETRCLNGPVGRWLGEAKKGVQAC